MDLGLSLLGKKTIVCVVANFHSLGFIACFAHESLYLNFLAARICRVRGCLDLVFEAENDGF